MTKRITRGTRVPPTRTIGRVNLSGGIRPGVRTRGIDDNREDYYEKPKRLDEELLDLIGKGIAYPFEFSSDAQGVSGLSASWGKNKINQSIFLILSTRPGERFFVPTFGSRLPLLVFEPYDDALRTELDLEVRGALERWEPRITVVGVDIMDDENFWENGQIGISIDYVIKNSNIRSNYVYPYQMRGEPVT